MEPMEPSPITVNISQSINNDKNSERVNPSPIKEVSAAVATEGYSLIRVPSQSSTDIPRTRISKNWCISGVEVANFNFTWTIKNFSFCAQKVGKKLESSTFTVNGNHKLCLHLYPIGDKEENKSYLSLGLALVSSSIEAKIPVMYEFSILNAKNEKSNLLKSEEVVRIGKGSCEGDPRFIKRDYLLSKANKLLPNDNLTIYCEGYVPGNKVKRSGHCGGFQAELAGNKHSENLGALFENQKFSDVVLSVGTLNVHVHKAILAAQSPLFAAMFEVKMESGRNKVVVTDVDYEILIQMLSYIYTGKLPSTENISANLLVAAHKYGIVGLELICQEFLSSTLCVENAADLLVLADEHRAEQLKEQAIYFIHTHIKKVKRTLAWKNMILNRPQLLAEIFESLTTE